MSNSFVHCHVHSEYSMLDGASRVDDIVQTAKEDGQPAVSITDHGNMYGVIPFYQACQKAEIKPIIGTEIYMAYDHRTERLKLHKSKDAKLDDTGSETEGGKKQYYHMILLAENNVGYQNLIKLSSLAYLEGYYYKPKVDWELLEQYHEGIIATTGCLGGHVLQSLLNGNDEEALQKAARLQDIFGRDNLFVEIQDHGIDKQQWTNPKLLEIAKKINAPVLATNDSHYTKREDAVAHDTLLCLQTGSLISDEKRFKFEGTDHYVKSAAEMRKLFSSVPEACDNSLWIAERTNVEIEFGKGELPDFPLPKGFSSAEKYLRYLAMRGACSMYGKPIPRNVLERLEYELSSIEKMGFSAYFLIVHDLINYARLNDIRVGPGRGSVAGCLVAYCLKIHDLDPLKYDLLFERFLNPSRVSMPDIDMDFDTRYREQMMQYAISKYGRYHAAQIVTYQTIKARAAVRDAARILGYPYEVAAKINKAMPDLIAGRDTPLQVALADAPSKGYEASWERAEGLRSMVQDDPQVEEIVDIAKGLEGLRRQEGMHAAALVITRNPLMDYLPIQRKNSPNEDPETCPIVTQYEMHAVEDLGLLKMDFLGLRNLDVIDMTEKLLAKRGVHLDTNKIPLDDQRTFEMLQAGKSVGVFQLESVPMRNLMRRLQPTSLDDIAALVALYRPGPMADNMHNDYADRKNGRKPITYLHPDAEEVLSDTYGLMIYQEKLMKIAQKFAGYSLAEADLLRKACGKKVREIIEKEEDKFIQGCINSGYGRTLGEKWFSIIEPFADYAFNKSHAYGYGLVAYQTSYLKANFTVEYFCAMLTSVKDDLEKAGIYLAECRSMGVPILIPDINTASVDFVPDESGNNIIYGLSSIRNIGTNTAEAIVSEREQNGLYESFDDLCSRVSVPLNKKWMESLIYAGSFDSLGYSRKGLLNSCASIMSVSSSNRKKEAVGQFNLFSTVSDGSTRTPVPNIEFSKKLLLSHEKEMLSMYVSDHPLNGLERLLKAKSDCSIDDLFSLEHNDVRVVTGMIASVERKHTHKGDLMAVFQLQDNSSTIEVVVFPYQMQRLKDRISEDGIVSIRGKINIRDENVNLICMDIAKLDNLVQVMSGE